MSAPLFLSLFTSQVARTPDTDAVICGDQRLTYRQLDTQANGLAHALRTQGVACEVPVGVCMTRRLELVTAALAILKSGGVFLPLDPEHPDERLQAMVGDAGAAVLLTESALAARLPGCGAARLVIDEPEAWPRSGDDPNAAIAPEQAAYIIYTSGSTGSPKGVVIPHGGLASYVQWCLEAYLHGDGNGAPVLSSIGFDLTITALLTPLAAGQPVHVMPPGHAVEALERAFRSGADFSFIKLTPAHLALMPQVLRPEDLARSTRALIIGGEQLLEDQLIFFRSHAPRMRLINEYGPTETVVGCCVHEAATRTAAANVPIGRAITDVQVYLLDDDRRPLPADGIGELFIGGASMARGYHGKPALTAAAFVPDPFSGERGARLYRTGDLARRLPDGSLEYLGRKDTQLKVRGMRVEPGEIEATLCRHTAVRQAFVMADGETGDLIACVVAHEDQTPQHDSLRDFLQERLPLAMIPTTFVCVDALPLTAHGKVDRAALAALAASPRLARPARLDGRLPRPATALERTIAEEWEAVLERPVSVTANYFDLGGTSRQLVDVHQRLAQRLGATVSLIDLFSYPTVRSLAGHLTSTLDTHAVAAPPPPADDETRRLPERRRLRRQQRVTERNARVSSAAD